ncbi:diuretic hormone 45 isoform X1 [Euwallacea similis]|uniref:diuretic hormone 45 isoform X1 n=1 Tax=Euwallacea similis TaxID=1736056 RepID=UPI00344CCA2C
MRAPIYLVCAALAVAVHSEENQNYLGLESVNVAADPETINYLLPKLAAKYRPSNEWRGVTDPRFYVLTEMESDDIENQEPTLEDSNDPEFGLRRKRQSSRINEAGGSLSIVNSLDVLRNRLLLEIARKKAKEGANRNRQLLLNFGKRGFLQRMPHHRNI